MSEVYIRDNNEIKPKLSNVISNILILIVNINEKPNPKVAS